MQNVLIGSLTKKQHRVLGINRVVSSAWLRFCGLTMEMDKDGKKGGLGYTMYVANQCLTKEADGG